MTFPTLSPSIQLYPYQKDAVARIIFSPNTLLAHDVGSGKTYVMIAAGQELRRMGLSRKNMYVVPNNIVGQWRDIFLTMYPDAKLLCVWPKAFTPGKREKVLEKMQNEDFDGIIIAYSCFEQIPLSKAYSLRTLEWKKEEIDRISAQNKKATSRLERKRRALEKVFSELSAAMDEMCGAICFDDLGITRLFVDEAHNFKNVPIDTQTANVLGVCGAGSKKCQDMMDKVHMVQRENSGGGVVFATGTPITNSITDAYIMQQYLQSGELTMLDLQSFDSWIGMFAERATEFEIDVDTKQYRLATRFAKFHNLPELTSLLSSIADFHQADRSAGLPELDGYQDAVISKTPAFSAYLDRISDRAEEVRNGWVSRSEDNMLKITADGRKAALDLRLVDSKALGDQLGGQGNFPRFRVRLTHDLIPPVGQERHRSPAPVVEIVLVHVGGTAVNDGFMTAGQAAHSHLLFQNAGDDLGLHGNGVFPVPVVLRHFQGVDVVPAVGGDFNDFPAQGAGQGSVLTLGVDDDNIVPGGEGHVLDRGFHSHRLAGARHAQIEGMGGDQPLAVTDQQVLADGVHPIGQAAGVLYLLDAEGHKDGCTLGGQGTQGPYPAQAVGQDSV